MSEMNLENGVIIRPYRASDAEGMLAEMQRTYKVESPTYGGYGGGIAEAECEPYFLRKIQAAERDGVSYVAIDTRREGSPIIGCVLSTVEDRTKPNWRNAGTHGATSKKLQKAFTEFYGTQFFNVDFKELENAKVLYLDAFSVDAEYRRQKLCNRMVELSIRDAVAKHGCTVATVLVTSYKSIALVENMGFTVLRAASFEEYNKTQTSDECKFVIRDPKNLTAKYMMKIIG